MKKVFLRDPNADSCTLKLIKDNESTGGTVEAKGKVSPSPITEPLVAYVLSLPPSLSRETNMSGRLFDFSDIAWLTLGMLLMY